MPAISGVTSNGEVGVAVHQIDVAREDGLPVADEIDVGGAAPARGEDAEIHAVAGLVDSAVGAQQDLIVAGARFERERAGSAIAAAIVGVDAQGLGSPVGLSWMTATPLDVGRGLRVGHARAADAKIGLRGRAVRVRGEHIDLVFDAGNELAAFGHGEDQQRRAG